MRWFLILLSGLLINLNTFGQQSDTLNYVLVVKDDTIGNLIAIKNTNLDSSIIYVVKSVAHYKFLFSFEIIFDYYTRFDPDGFVSQTDFVYEFNGKVKEENKMERNDSGYDIYMEGKHIKEVEGFYPQSALSMYFHEPDINKPILSERFLDEIKIEKVNKHEYRVEFPTEDVNDYHYKNGICVKIVIDLKVANMEIRLVN
jgi:hypothetical protein